MDSTTLLIIIILVIILAGGGWLWSRTLVLDMSNLRAILRRTPRSSYGPFRPWPSTPAPSLNLRRHAHRRTLRQLRPYRADAVQVVADAREDHQGNEDHRAAPSLPMPELRGFTCGPFRPVATRRQHGLTNRPAVKAPDRGSGASKERSPRENCPTRRTHRQAQASQDPVSKAHGDHRLCRDGADAKWLT
jgi:hypothetical protein